MPPSRRRRAPSGARQTQAPLSSQPHSAESPAQDDPSPGQRDHYSYQEMVDHLRKVRASSGEQGLKSKKKRRRRSYQPIREKRRRRLRTMLVLLLVVLPIGSFIVGSFLLSYVKYEREPFREEMSANVSRALGMRGEFADLFNVSRLKVKNRGFSARGSSRSLLEAFDLSGIEAQLRVSSFLSSEWRIPRVGIEQAMLHLRPLPAKTDAEAAAPVPEETHEILAAGLGLSGVPESYQVERINFRRLDAFFGANPDLPHRLEGLRVAMDRRKDGFSINVDRGLVKYFYWPEFQIVVADLFLDSEKLEVERAELVTTGDLEDPGTCEVTGEIRFSPSPSVDLSMDFSNISLGEVVNADHWGERVLGRVSGKLTVKGGLTVDDLPVIKGKIQIPELSIRNLPILTKLSTHFGMGELKRMRFDVFEAQIHQEGSTIGLHDIYGYRPGVAGLTGAITVQANHTIHGAFEFGLPDQTLEKMHDGTGGIRGRPDFFHTRVGAPLFWATFTVTGNLEEPEDTLGSQLEDFFQRNRQPAEQRQSTQFQRPPPLSRGPSEAYRQRLQDLFEHFTSEAQNP